MQGYTNNKMQLGRVELTVYRCICYFDVFQYPVKPTEILEFSDSLINKDELFSALEELKNLELITNSGEYYFLSGVDPLVIDKRTDAVNRFAKKKRRIKKFASFIARFPFVELVALSGSCSKGLLEKDGDVDYFIITSPNKLWLCRTFLVAFKKIFLFNSKKYFCVNYFLSSDNLVIPDRNLFVACEISTLIPVSNKLLFETYLQKNNWINEYLPNKSPYNTHFLLEKEPKKYFSRIIELIFNGKFGDFFDRLFFRFTLSTWEKKFPEFNKEDFDLNLRSKKNVSKHHPRGFQKKVLNEYESRLDRISGLSF